MNNIGRILLAACLAAPSLVSAIVIDGTVDAEYGSALSTQTHQTQFGDSSIGQIDFANGSELDNAYAVIVSNTLYLALAGNIESNFNKLELFFDTRPGGQNRLRGDNPDVDFNGLNRLGDNGSTNGLTFDSDFEADFYITFGGGGAVYAIFPNYAELGNPGVGRFLGAGTAASDGTLLGGVNPDGIRLTINNSNTNGVSSGNSPNGPFTPVATGVEMAIPLSALANPCGTIKMMAAVNASSHDFLSNQMLGGFDTTNPVSNLGEPRNVNLESLPGKQYFTIFQGMSNVYQIVGSSMSTTVSDSVNVQWQSETGKTYAVFESTNIMTGFALLTNNVVATAPTNTITDTVPGFVKKFYYIQAVSGCP